MRHPVKQRAIFALLDDRLTPSKRRELKAHLDECEPCRRYSEEVAAARIALRKLGAAAPPPVDWDQVDAGLEAGLEAQPRQPLFGSLVTWSALAAAAAAAFFITWMVVDEPPPAEPPATASASAPAQEPSEPEKAAPRLVDAFVTFVAGSARLGPPGSSSWSDLRLEAPIEQGTRLRTSERSAAGLQLGADRACRLADSTDVQLTNLGSPSIALELEQGQVTCSTSDGDERPPLVLAVMDVVASASGEARFALRRQGRLVIVELAEGRVEVEAGDQRHELASPGRLELRQTEGGEVEVVEVSDETPELAEVPTMARRSIASLHLPPFEAIERVEIDGVDYGPPPLQLRRRPGNARLLLFTAGGDSITHELEVGLGPRTVELASLGIVPEAAPSTSGEGERRVAPRIGSYNDEQIRRLRGLVGSQVRGCYERMLKRNPSIWGRIQVRFTVSTRGDTRRVQVRNLSGGHPSVNACIEQSLGQQRFPPPRGGYIPVEQTITLSPRF